MAAGPGLIRLAVFGHPIGHSLSPRIHLLFAEQCGLEVDYRAIDATPEDFLDAVRALAAGGATGCNVTLPHKGQAWAAAARCSEVADRARAANTLVFDTPGSWFADNTDGRGLVADLERHCAGGPAGRRLLLIGAGGAAAGVLGALLQSGPASVHVANRTPERARELAARHADLGTVEWSGLETIEATDEPFDLVIQTTSAGLGGDGIELSPALFAPNAVCYDLCYGDAAEPLRRRCEAHGIAYADGLGMLVEQAALSFELWTGRTPDTHPVLAALRQGGHGDDPPR